ncbi:DUF4858 domain-containing protein [Bacteroides eggerthii]|uniref:DUF4858 domain-containing protein n=1 Tax=Bacteroides eggerthii TaxID=28111 RepID=UPI001C3769CF|nr:DUF4858 domain-containing protein [Bacteroides eggerthii]MBV3843162.1 DUF4858 domain-containing protein [Bacteroides eggerthii]MBV3846491.1 DUF4858 domain-containing protein [Bacteroides eggerthii]MBV3884257.1 DUF4858 domain-containing protein [Bacteroides eggerthii]MBV3891206.1 DUF4858 domain-containing protein [Bacteroides eggerthii]MBV3902367.1 DUF4858 domain-containing protein [Bacteroides eggerthii]
MKYFILFLGLLFVVAFPLYAQEWTPQDSLHLRRFLSGEGEVRLNPDVLKEIGIDSPLGSPKEDMNKSWLEFDSSLPVMPQKPEKKVVLTLRPYTANTKYNWDPVYQKKITVNKNTWRSSPFYELTKLKIYTNWAKRPLDAGPRESVEQIEATGLRYMVTERANNMAVGSWRGVGGGGISGDFMAPFTKDFWNIKGRKRRARTLEVLKTYGDSISVRRNDAIIK